MNSKHIFMKELYYKFILFIGHILHINEKEKELICLF